MSSVKVDNITKIYKLYGKPVARLKEFILHRPFHKELVALNGVSFSLEKGETFGVIGDNGAGKSTLLKIIARTLSPTHGTIETNGLVSSLLELGTGFHPEFTGIENIYFYGSLLGINSSRMKNKIQDIIDFSELGEFIHYPIKTYSSGMHIRLAFSVATSVDPDVFIIDEALSVGDQYFQRKCLEKMAEFRKLNKTIIFCSHDMYQIKTFCEKTMWLDHGNIRMTGKTDDIVNAYIGYEQAKAEKATHSVQTSSFLFIRKLKTKQQDKTTLEIEFTVTVTEPFVGHLGWGLFRHDQLQISFMTTKMQDKDPVHFDGTKRIRISVRNLNVLNGTYIIYAGVFDREAYRPIAIETTECELETGYDILNSLCHFDSTFLLE
jgi:ABC-type polysaccharide/polyol phosphate transport system ATPase subunit